MTEQKHSLEAFFHNHPRRARAIIAAACIGIAALVLVICLVVGGGEEPAEAESSGVEVLQAWPDSPLLEGIPCPEDGSISSARQTESTVAVFFEEFPSGALEAFLDATGLEFRGTAPYVAEADGRTIAVEYDAKEGTLSITVIKE